MGDVLAGGRADGRGRGRHRRPGARRSGRAGFALAELMIVVAVLAIAVTALGPRMGRTLEHARVNRAARLVAADLIWAQSLAVRLQQPVYFTVDAPRLNYRIWDQSRRFSRTRRLDRESEYRLSSLRTSSRQITVLPQGNASASLTLTLAGRTYRAEVTMTRAGQVRVRGGV